MADTINSERVRASRSRTPGSPSGTEQGSDAFAERVMELLSQHERMALRMRHSQGLDDLAIAARMNLPEAIVRDLLRRAELTVRAAQAAFLEALAEHSRTPARVR